MKKHTLNITKITTLLATGLSFNALAAETTSAPDIRSIEVKGTYIEGYTAHSASGASKLELDILDIPQSVSIITTAQMDDFQLKEINAALDSVTGVNVERIETDRTYYTARGFDITNFQIDGIGLPLTSGNNHADEDTAIYDRVEVIRGANGLMTGVGNPSATINFIRKRPTPDRLVAVNARVGSWDNKRLDVDFSSPITESISGRFVAVKQDKGSYLDRYETDKNILYAFLDAKLTNDTTISLSHSYINNDATGNNWGALPLFYTDGSATNYDISTNTSANWSNWQVEKNNTVLELSHFFNNGWNLRATYSHKTTDEDTELFYVYGTPDKETELGLFGYASEYDLDDELDTFDLYVKGNFSLFNKEHELVVGLNQAKMNYIDTSLYDYTTGNGFPVMPDLNTWDGDTPLPTFSDGLTGSDISQEQKAAYFTARFNIFDNFHLIAGGRHNDWQVIGSTYDVAQDVDDMQFIPYLGLVYEFVPGVVGYASYTETFISQTELDINDKILDPITGESKELGLKSEFFGGNLIASAAYFDVVQSNVAKLDPSTESLPADQQRHIGVDGISSKGYEIDVAGRLYNGLQVSIGYTDFDIDGDDLVKNYTPSKLFKLAAVYSIPQINALSVGINMRWQDKTSRAQGVVGSGFVNAGQDIITTQKAYSVINLMARYEFGDNVSLLLNANNMTDEKYLNSLYWAQGFYGSPANYSATLSWKL